MPGFGLIFLQLAAAGAPSQAAAPDIELNARVDARDLTIRQETPLTVSLHAEPGQAPPISVQRSAPAGAKTYRNLTLRVHGEARLTDTAASQSQQGNDNGDRQP